MPQGEEYQLLGQRYNLKQKSNQKLMGDWNIKWRKPMFSKIMLISIFLFFSIFCQIAQAREYQKVTMFAYYNGSLTAVQLDSNGSLKTV